MKSLALLVVLALTASIAAAKHVSPEPASTIINAAPEAVKAQIVVRLMSRGYHLETDTPYQMVWSKEMNNSTGMLAQLIGGNANCALPRWVLSLAFAPQGGGILMIGTEQLDVAGELCVRSRTDMDGKKQRTEMNSFLADIKEKAESAPAQPTAVAKSEPVAPVVAPKPSVENTSRSATPASTIETPGQTLAVVPSGAQQPESLGDYARRMKVEKSAQPR
jgi:hypothetical protein